MKRSLIAGATAVGVLFAALATPATAAASAEASASIVVECDGAAESEAAAVALAAACGDDVEVLGASGSGAELFAEPNGGMRFEASAVDPYVSRQSTARTVLRSAGPSGYGWTGTQWVGYCDPVEYAEGCDAAGVQRLVWQFDGVEILRDLAPGDVTSAELIANGDVAWLDDVSCTPNKLDLYDIPRISASTGWASTAAWTQDRHVGGSTFYWPECEQTPAYTGYFDFDATQLAVNAARDNRSSVTVGVRAADETCMTCGWNSFEPHATLIVRFNRAPLAPTALGFGNQDPNTPCTGDEVLRTTGPILSANIVDPDPDSSHVPADPAGAPVTATFRIAHVDAPDVVLWEGTESIARSGSHYVFVPSGTLTSGRYVWTVFATDDGGLVGPSASCTFSVDITKPVPTVVVPVLGGQAVYMEEVVRGGIGIPGSFLLTSASDDVVRYEYGINTQTATEEVVASANTVLTVSPTRAGYNFLSIHAIDRAGNVSAETRYVFYVSFSTPMPTPPAITVTGPTSYTFGGVPTFSATLSADATTPHGTVTVRSGSTTVGSAAFDERTEAMRIDGSALGAGTKTLTFTYRAFPGAPAWSTQRVVTIRPLTFSVSRSPSVSGTAQVGRTLTATRGSWTPSPTTARYQWRLDGRAVFGATSSTWKIPGSAKGRKISVAVTGSRTGYATRTVVSPATTAVKAGVFVAPRPTITGTQRVGYTLRAVRGTWTPQPSTVRYQWKVDGAAVRGATGSAFRVPASARGKRIVVSVTGLRAGYTTRTVASYPTSVIR
jgi:hypothetical protein